MARLATTRRSAMGWVPLAKAVAPPFLWSALYRALVVGDIPGRDAYRPHFSPWLEPEFAARFAAIRPFTEVLAPSCWTLWRMIGQALHVEGDVMEAGVFRGGTAKLLKDAMAGREAKRLVLFDSFEGMARTSAGLDRHRAGDFSDTSLEGVQAVVGVEAFIEYRKGWIPESFTGLEARRFCFAHIDLDLYESIADSLEFIWPRLSPGGIVVFDDYAIASCPGARRAVDEFFADRPESPLALTTGQALVVKLPPRPGQ